MTKEDRPFKYKAFISHSHADRRWAKWMHERLERYRIPRSLRRAYPALSPKIGTVFKDREELGTSPDLGETIRAALRESEFLIVLASSDAAGSRWVNEEIRYFLDLHGPSNLILVIPPAEKSAGLPAFSTLEERELEPIAADARSGADGQIRAFCKVISALIGVNFDELQQRDRTRTRHRLLFAGSAVVVIATAILLLTLRVQQTTQDAEAQRLQAAQLANYLVDDLSSRLDEYEEVGTLDSGLTQALEYFEAADLTQMENQTLQNYRAALVGIGSVRIRQGVPQDALDVFLRAESVSREIVNREQDNAQQWKEQALATYYIGEAYWEMQDVPSAAQYIEQSVEYAQRALELSPANFEYQLEVIFGLNNLGAINSRLKRWRTAEEFSTQALETIKDLVENGEVDEEQKLELLNQEVEAISWLSEITQTLGSFDAAFVWHQREIELRKTLYNTTNNIHHQARLIDAMGYFSKSLKSVGRIDEEERVLEEALKITETLIESDPGNVFWRTRMHANQGLLAFNSAERGQMRDAVSMFNIAEAGLQEIVDNEGTRVAAFHLAYIMSMKAYLEIEGDRETSRQLIRQALDHLSESLDESSIHPVALEYFVNAVLIEAALSILEGKSPDADQLPRALELIGSPAANSGSVFDIASRSLLLSASGNSAEAQALDSFLESVGYRHPFYVRMSDVFARRETQ